MVTCSACDTPMRLGIVWPHSYWYCPLCGEFDDDSMALIEQQALDRQLAANTWRDEIESAVDADESEGG